MTAAIYLIADGRTRPAPPNECTSLLGLSPLLCLYGERETNGAFNDASWDGLVWGRAERQISPSISSLAKIWHEPARAEAPGEAGE